MEIQEKTASRAGKGKKKMLKMKNTTPIIEPWTRIAIILVSLVVFCIISKCLTGTVVPTDPSVALIFQNALLLIILGSTIQEHKFTTPGQATVNALMGAVTLITVYGKAPKIGWWFIFSYCVLVFVIAGLCTAVSSGRVLSGKQEVLRRFTYKPAVTFGKGRLLYSIVFLFGVLSFYSVQSVQTLTLVIFWGIFMAIWPLGLPQLLSGFRKSSEAIEPCGQVIRTEAPNMIRVRLRPETDWSPTCVKLYQQNGKSQYYVVPLFSQEHGEDIVGVGLRAEKISEPVQDLRNGFLYDDPSFKKTEEEIGCLLGAGQGVKLIGFVSEDSKIEAINFQTISSTCCKEGMTIWCKVGETLVYYQITEGTTKEEPLESNKHGFQIATASQLGLLDNERGFSKYEWLPAMNTPVFAVAESFGDDSEIVKEGDFTYGNVPGTKLKIGGAFADILEYHTAILGITGSGKTELAFDLIKHAVNAGTKVICVDLTQLYKGRLSDLKPNDLSLSPELTKALGEKLFAVESGTFGSGPEKKALKDFAVPIREDVKGKVKDFIEKKDEDNRVGIITLEEISNTKATIYITEIFLTCILHYARDNSKTCPRILIVLEEAHTIIPEANTMGLGDFDSKGLVAKISQIALQGRKYGVGLLVISQRTATVSKTVLTQCNTIVTFSCIDETSLRFLGNVLDKHHVALIPNLPFLQAVVFGKGVRSERPIVVKIPYDKSKDGTLPAPETVDDAPPAPEAVDDTPPAPEAADDTPPDDDGLMQILEGPQ